jgi:hypothetical protein
MAASLGVFSYQLTDEFRDAGLPGYELGSRGTEASELLSVVQWS